MLFSDKSNSTSLLGKHAAIDDSLLAADDRPQPRNRSEINDAAVVLCQDGRKKSSAVLKP